MSQQLKRYRGTVVVVVVSCTFAKRLFVARRVTFSVAGGKMVMLLELQIFVSQ